MTERFRRCPVDGTTIEVPDTTDVTLFGSNPDEAECTSTDVTHVFGVLREQNPTTLKWSWWAVPLEYDL